MQTWHCIALIIISVAVFFYASFMDEIEERSKSSLLVLSNQSIETSQVSVEEPLVPTSTTWAEILLTLESGIAEPYALIFHEEALESAGLINTLYTDLEKSPIAKELIFSPFTSELLDGNERQILSSLISIRPRSKNSLEVICKGHSNRSADLLSEMMIRTYNQLIHSETIESPLPLSLNEKFKKHQELQSQMEELKVKIQEETEGSPEESVEVMAIRSEIMQVEDEVNLYKNHLLKIEEIHQDKLDPMEYLHIPPIRDFGQVSQLGNILEQLKSMRLDQTLNKFTREEVEKKILATSQDLEMQVVSAIDYLKKTVSELLLRKKDLQKTIFDHISEAKLALSQSENIRRFKQIKIFASDLHKDYEDETLKWIACKSSYTLYRTPK
jgi:hypothetical protein